MNILCIEAQVAAVADDIAYMSHDLDDGLRSGLISVDELPQNPLLQPRNLEPSRQRFALVRGVLEACVFDVIDTSRRLISAAHVASDADVRALGRPLVQFSPSLWEHMWCIRSFLYDNLYRHPTILTERARCEAMLEDLFTAFITRPDLMAQKWADQVETCADKAALGTLVTDYIAGMTDRYAEQAFKQLP